MGTGRMLRRLASAILLLQLVDTPTRVQAIEKDVPPDFRIDAEYWAGFSAAKSWKVTIGSDGTVTQEIRSLGGETSKKTFTLTKSDLNDLLEKVEKANFFELSKVYDCNVTDANTLIFEITANKRTHRVRVYAPSFQKQVQGVKQFQIVWSELLRKVPSPNPQKKVMIRG